MSNNAAIDAALRKARKLGIPREHLKQALILVRELRINALQLRLDPRATRIALLYAERCDYHAATGKLSVGELAALRWIADELAVAMRFAK